MKVPRVVIVTGGAAGIGWAACQRFAKAGDHVVIVDRDGQDARSRGQELGSDHLALTVDVSREADIREMVAACIARYGRLDVLVNNAGVIDAQAKPAFEQPLAEFQSLIGVNVTGCFLAAREAARVMSAQGGGVIVNLASGAGVAAVPYRNGYGASKAAVTSLTRTMACEWASKGIRVNAVAPGYTRTAMVERLVANGKVDPALVERRIPLGRMADPDEIAEVLFYLASDRASYITGSLVVADGGFLAFGGTGAASTGPAPRPCTKGPRIVAVTGGATEVVRRIAATFAADGDRVLAIDRDDETVRAAASSLGPGHMAVCCDMTDEAAVEAALQAAVDRWGSLDILVNGAGGEAPISAAIDQTGEDFEAIWNTHLTGVYLASRAAGRHMARMGGGAIVNIASIAGLAALKNRHAFCAADAGVMMLSKSLACEWAHVGIRVNAIAAGHLQTSKRDGAGEEGDIIRRTPMGRLGSPQEVADVVRFLASDAASYLTGSVIGVDGGWSAFGDAGGASDGR